MERHKESHLKESWVRSDQGRFLSKFSRKTAAVVQPILPVILLLLTLQPVQARGGMGQLNDDPRSLRDVAFEHYINNDMSTALDFYQKAVDKAVKEYGADSSYVGNLYFEMGVLAFDAGWFQKAENYLTKAVQQNPNSIEAKVKLAELLEVRDRPDLALGQIQQALAKRRNSPEARHALVMYLIKQHNTAAAVHESYLMTLHGVPLPDKIKPAIPEMTKVAQEPAEKPKDKPATETKPPAIASISGAKPITPGDFNGIMRSIFKATQPKPAEPAKAKPPAKQPEKIKPPAEKKKHAKPKEKHEKRQPIETVKPEDLVPQSAVQEILHTTARVEKKKPDTPKAKAQPSENEPKPVEHKEAPPQEQPPPQMPVTFAPPPPMQPTKKGKPRAGFVPPPPPMAVPMVPMFPVVPQQPVAQPPHPKPKPKVKPPEDTPPPAQAADDHPAATSHEDPDFLLDWSGVDRKKKKGAAK